MANLETYGDLKTLINNINKRQKGDKIISKGKEFALDQVLGLIPGASNAKTAFDFIKTAISKPDTKKTNTWLDKLDIDDDMSKIIDDTVENGFMQAMASSIESEPDTKSLEDDFNMNAKMVNYLKNTYKGRTVTGIKESIMKKSEFKKLIKEQILEITIDSPKLQGQIKTDVWDDLKIKDFNRSNFNNTISLVKNKKMLNVAANTILANTFIALLNANDEQLRNAFNNLKQFK
jgi:hypothetical protein